MFTNISWADYLVVITLLLAGYYLLIGFRFYSQELRNWLLGLFKSGLRPFQNKTISVPAISLSPADFQEKLPKASETLHLPENLENNPIAETDQVNDYLKEVIAEAAAQADDKTAFIRLLQLVLNEHPALQEYPFRSAIQDLVISESQKYGSLTLSEAEVIALWQTED